MSLKDKNINVAPKEGVNEMLVQVEIVCLVRRDEKLLSDLSSGK